MEKVERLTKFAHNYSQAPWRKQWQFIGLFSLALVLIAMVASIYLNISAQAATVGRNIQYLQWRLDITEEEIEDLQADVALLLSAEEMVTRTEDDGFVPLDSEQFVYLTIPGYVGRQPAVMAPNSNRTNSGASQLPVEYTETLFDYLRRNVQWFSLPNLEKLP